MKRRRDQNRRTKGKVKETKEVKEEVKKNLRKKMNLSSKTLVELKEIAKERGIKDGALKKMIL